ncbi:MAG: GtrA family protein [Pseudomonadota bacterium]
MRAALPGRGFRPCLTMTIQDRRPAASTLTRFLRFVAVGGFATILMYILLVIGIELLGLAPVVASVSAYAISALANYWLNHRITFRSAQRHRVALFRFAVISGCGLILNGAIVYAGTEVWSAHYLLVQVFATVCVLFWNFLGSQLWTFRASTGN